MNLSKEYKSLIETLINYTENNQLKWNEGDSNDQFYVHLKAGTAMVDKYTGDSKIYYGFKLLNTTGKEIGSYEFYENVSNTSLQELYNLIEKKYFKVEEIIDSMIKEITSGSSGEIKKEEEKDTEDDLPF